MRPEPVAEGIRGGCGCVVQVRPSGPGPTYTLHVRTCRNDQHRTAAARARARFFNERATRPPTGDAISLFLRLLEAEILAGPPEPPAEPWRRLQFMISQRLAAFEGDLPAGCRTRQCCDCGEPVVITLLGGLIPMLTRTFLPICNVCAIVRRAETGDNAWTYDVRPRPRPA